jgi:hypothetical protein
MTLSTPRKIANVLRVVFAEQLRFRIEDKPVVASHPCKVHSSTSRQHRKEVTMSLVDTILEHHGVKGMRWGVRTRGLNTGKVFFEKDDGTKRTTRVGRITTAKPKRKTPSSADFKKAQAARSKVKRGRTHALTNEELQALNKRMNLEKQFRELSGKTGDKKAAKAGATWVAKFLGSSAEGIAKAQVQRVGNDIVSKQINDMFKKAK